MGRPKLDDDEKTVIVGVRMTVEMRDQLDRYYKHRDSRSEAIRSIIARALRQMRDKERIAERNLELLNGWRKP